MPNAHDATPILLELRQKRELKNHVSPDGQGSVLRPRTDVALSPDVLRILNEAVKGTDQNIQGLYGPEARPGRLLCFPRSDGGLLLIAEVLVPAAGGATMPGPVLAGTMPVLLTDTVGWTWRPRQDDEVATVP